jgi:RNase P protein component
MKEIVVSVPDKEYTFFMKLVKSFDFVTVVEPEVKPPSKQQFLNELKQAVQEVNDIKAGKKKGESVKDFLIEL